VGVWFSHPDNEIREQTYPYMVISMIDVTEATDRVMSGYYDEAVPVHAFPTEALPDEAYYKDGHFWIPQSDHPMEFLGKPPMPVQIDYQIRLFSRHPRHARVMLADFLGEKIPYRYAELNMGYVDGGARRMHLLDIGHAETIENNKRLFVSSFTVRVDSFMPSGEILVVMKIPVRKVIGIIRGHTPEWYERPWLDTWVNEAPEEKDEANG
jgi:hypothetical protein